jgi:hypothetical protein
MKVNRLYEAGGNLTEAGVPFVYESNARCPTVGGARCGAVRPVRLANGPRCNGEALASLPFVASSRAYQTTSKLAIIMSSCPRLWQ